jgi:hypothetical protein
MACQTTVKKKVVAVWPSFFPSFFFKWEDGVRTKSTTNLKPQSI